jgi:acetyltransferase
MRIVLPADRPKYEMSIKDGSVVTLSPILKTDREFLEKGLLELSIDSRFARFGQGVAGLSKRELAYLTDVDQRTHVAWGATIDEEAAGVGRYIVPEDGGCPELAVTVIDRFQGRGVAHALLEALIAVARADGHEEFCFESRGDNVAVKRLLAEIEIGQIVLDGTVERRIRLSDFPKSSREKSLLAVIDEVRR